MRPRIVAHVIAAGLVLVLVAGCAPLSQTWTFRPETSGAPAEPDGSGSPGATPSASSAEPSAAPSASVGAATTWTVVRETTCPGLETFECVTLAVPRDHFGPAGGPTWEVTFAIHRATSTRKGTYVEITGGPGYSDIPSSDDYVEYYDPAVVESYDLVYLDQRGIGLSGPIQCIKAAAIYYATPARPQIPAERDAAAAAAETFAADCIEEAGVAESDLPFYATKQAVEDLEAVRQYLDVDKLDLYGLSYGTQFVQTYAAAHPEHIAALYVDGPVDLTLDGIDYYVETARSAEDAVVETLDACTADETCSADVVGGDALAVYDDLAERLAAGRIEYAYTTTDGTDITRQLTANDLENAAYYAIYYPSDRLLLQRAIAAASHGNYVPLVHLAADAIGVDADSLGADPSTLEPIEDPTWSDALYYAVECQDYAFYPDLPDADARLDAWIAEAEEAGANDTRLATSLYGDVPCLYWPTASTDETRPAPILDPPYPVFVLASTTDPATPIANGMRIYSRLQDAWFIQAVGGPHVIYAWGNACPDELMTAWLTERTPPSLRVTTCPWDLTDPYVPIAPATASDYDDALAVVATADDQIFNTNDYINGYDGTSEVTIGCDFGGTLTYEPTDVGTDVTLTGCEFTDGLPLTGTGSADDEEGTFELDVTSGDDDLQYERDADGNTSVSGTYEGEAVDLEEAA